MTSAKLKQFIYQKVLYLVIVGIYKMDININNRICNYFNNIIQLKFLVTENTRIDEKNYNNLAIYFTNYINSKSTKMLSLHYHELMVRNVEKKYLIVHDYILNKILEKFKEIICIEKSDVTMILINKDDKLPDDITLKKSCLINGTCY